VQFGRNINPLLCRTQLQDTLDYCRVVSRPFFYILCTLFMVCRQG
jgi:hypothetical protein